MFEVDGATLATWAGAVVTLVGAAFTASQARSARESLRLTHEAKEAALDQAHSARASAESASVAKDAAVDQARSARESVEVARAALHSADRPRFEITAAPRRNTTVMVTIKMVGGSPGLDVEVQWISQSSWPTSDASREIGRRVGQGLGRYQLFLNGEMNLGVEVPEESEKGDVRVILECIEMGEKGRTWQHVEVVEWERIAPRIY